MNPISTIDEVRPSNVVYHTAFGFASVVSMDHDGVVLRWERGSENLPNLVDEAALCRVYSQCNRGGFFDLSVNNLAELKRLTHLDPVMALELLLRDLGGVQPESEIERWLKTRKLVANSAFTPWFKRVRVLAEVDPRFVVSSDGITLVDPATHYAESLDDANLPPPSRIELATTLRSEIGEELFIAQIITAMIPSTTPVKQMALNNLEGADPNIVITEMIRLAPDELDTLIFSIRNGDWDSAQIEPRTASALVQHLLRPVRESRPIRGEPRLGAALATWGLPNLAELMLPATSTSTGRSLLRAMCDVLSPSRCSAFLADFSRSPGITTTTTNFIDRQRAKLDIRLRHQELTPTTIPRISTPGNLTPDSTTLSPVPIEDLAPERALDIVSLGVSLARLVARHHNQDLTIQPSSSNIIVHPDGTCTVDLDGLADLPGASPRPRTEPPSPAGDIYASAVLLLSALLGKDLDPRVPASRYLPFIRHLVPFLAPSAMAPLFCALQPNPRKRPTASLWLQQWLSVLDAENARLATTHNKDQRIVFGYDTHIGRLKMLHSQTNQDALYVSGKESSSLLMVCDGISTATAGSGDLAAAITTQVVANMWEQTIADTESQDLADGAGFADKALEVANRSVCDTSVRLANGALDGKVPMGTTAVLSICMGNSISISSLGDSRAYIVGPYGASLLTADQNQAGNRLVQWHAGHRERWDHTGYALVSYVGHFDDLGEPAAIPPKHLNFTLNAGETLVLCSDGVTDYIGDNAAAAAATLVESVNKYHSVQECAHDLVNRANRGGGGDNATVIVARAL